MAIGGIIIMGASSSGGAMGFALAATGVGGLLVALGLVVLLLAVLLIWGGIWAVTGRSYLLLLITASIFGALSLLVLIGGLSDNGNPVASIVGLLACAAIVVLLAGQPSRSWFALKHR